MRDQKRWFDVQDERAGPSRKVLGQYIAIRNEP